MKATELFEAAKRLPPGEQSAYISKRLPDVFLDSEITIWSAETSTPRSGRRTLIGIAPYSLADLQLLDAVAESLSKGHAKQERVEVFNILSCADQNDIDQWVPGIGKIYQTPVVGMWNDGQMIYKASGVEARRSIIEHYNQNS